MRTTSTATGIVLMLSSNIAFCLMAILIKTASNIDSFKTALFRFVIGMGLLATAALLRKIDLRFVHSPFLVMRGVIGGAAVYLFFLSVAKLGVAKGSVITYSYPMFAAILSAIFLKERLGLLKGICLVAAFGGIAILATGKLDSPADLLSFGRYELLAILGAFLAGVAVVLVKRLHDTDSTYAIFFAQCLFGMWLVVIPANIVPCEIGISGGVLLLSIGLVAAVGQLLMTEGYRHVTVTAGSILGMLLPVLNCFAGAWLFAEEFSTRSIIGSAIVIVSCAIISVDVKKAKKGSLQEKEAMTG